MTDDIFNYIDIEKTIAEFGYDPKNLSQGAKRKVMCKCISCEKISAQSYKDAIRNKTSCCSACSRSTTTLPDKETISKFLDDEKTVENFGYSIYSLSKSSCKPVMFCCPDCKTEEEYAFAYARKIDKCKKCNPKPKGKKQTLVTDDELSRLKIKKEETLSKFGYTVENFKTTDERSVVCECSNCQGDVVRIFRATFKRPNSICSACAKYIQSNRTKNLWAKGKMDVHKGRRHSQETKNKIASYNLGKKNPMFGKMPKNHKTGSKAGWHTKKDGSRVWLRSSWELKYAQYLDENNIPWEYEPKVFEVDFFYKGSKKEGTYTPDFYIFGAWVEVKGYWRDDAKPKFEAFKAQYPDENISLIMKSELLALGIDVE